MKISKHFCYQFFALFIVSLSGFAQSIEGRWDITVKKGDKEVPSWLEVTHSGVKYLTGRFVGESGSARPVSSIKFVDNKMNFEIPPQWEREEKDLQVNAELKNDKLEGTMNMPNGEIYNWVGVRAPKLIDLKEPTWGKPIKLFNGKNLEGWEAIEKANQWVAENDVLKSPKSGANLKTVAKFKDFKLHIEFRVPKGSNSGVYLRGRYEVQIMDSKGSNPSVGDLGAIYGFIQPLILPAKDPGVWQTYDITLVGRVVSVTLNGEKIIYKSEIPGITGGALDSNEAEAGPIMLQGDHGPIEYRNIVLTPAVK